MIVAGDQTTSGGVVIEGTTRCSIHGRAVALQGHRISCPACGSIGHIQLVPPFAGAPVDGVEIALSDDLCICGCNPPPRLVSSNRGLATHGFSAEELGDPAAAPWLAHAGHDPADYALPFDEQFLLQDGNGKPLAGVFFSVKLPTGKIVHGTTSNSGLTDRYTTEGAADLELYLGHIGVKFPEPLCKTTTNIKPNSVVVARSKRLAKPWQLSDKCIAFVGEWESGLMDGKNWKGHTVVGGLILTVYDDGWGIPTVGLGHAVVPGDHLKMGDSITLERANLLAKQDLMAVTDAISSSTKVPLFQHEFDAMASILFNTGIHQGRLEEFTSKLNQGSYKEIPEFITNFISNRTTSRRASEANLFKTGTYDAKH